MDKLNRSSTNSLVGGFGAIGFGLVFLSILMYLLSGEHRAILPPVLVIGTIGFIFLVSTLVINFKKKSA